MVDLTEGAAELIAFGAADAHIRTIRDQDAELTAIASASAGTAGIGLALTTLPRRAGLLGLPDGRHPRRAVGSARAARSWPSSR